MRITAGRWCGRLSTDEINIVEHCIVIRTVKIRYSTTTRSAVLIRFGLFVSQIEPVKNIMTSTGSRATVGYYADTEGDTLLVIVA